MTFVLFADDDEAQVRADIDECICIAEASVQEQCPEYR
jgi:hypothetical protein